MHWPVIYFQPLAKFQLIYFFKMKKANLTSTQKKNCQRHTLQGTHAWRKLLLKTMRSFHSYQPLVRWHLNDASSSRIVLVKIALVSKVTMWTELTRTTPEHSYTYTHFWLPFIQQGLFTSDSLWRHCQYFHRIVRSFCFLLHELSQPPLLHVYTLVSILCSIICVRTNARHRRLAHCQRPGGPSRNKLAAKLNSIVYCPLNFCVRGCYVSVCRCYCRSCLSLAVC